MDGNFLFQAFIYLSAAVIAVPIAKKFGLGSVLGYLGAGIIIGPLLGVVGAETKDLQHFAEFGVVMMLFLVGLELRPRVLWQMRTMLIGLGGLQVVLTTLVVTGGGLLAGLQWTVALAIGLIFSLSSTAIVLQSLNEKGLMKSTGGQASFSVLLLQDIAVIPMLALIPLLALPELASDQNNQAVNNTAAYSASLNLIADLPGWQVTLVTLGAIVGVILCGHYLSGPLFRFIARARLREIFTAAALLLIIGIALLMTAVGLSPALGTFLAGVVLAQSEFRHELESNIEPFKGLLLGLFFITVGAGINFSLLFSDFTLILTLTLGLVILKACIMLGLAMLFKVHNPDRWLFALVMAQTGEFGFVLLSFAVQNAVLPNEIAQKLMLVVALSLLLSPGLLLLFERVIAPRYSNKNDQEADEISKQGTVVIAGIGRFGGTVNRFLLSAGIRTVVLDYHAETLEMVRHFGVEAFYGDASRPDLLHSAGIEDAKVFVVAIDNMEKAIEIVKHVRREYPHINIVARASNRHDVYELYKAGADNIIRETFDGSMRAGRTVLEALNVHPFEAEKLSEGFIYYDVKALREAAKYWNPEIPITQNKEYTKVIRNYLTQLESAVKGNRSALYANTDRSWNPRGRKKELNIVDDE